MVAGALGQELVGKLAEGALANLDGRG